MPGLKHIKGKDYDRIAIRLLDTEWTGKLVTNSLMRMADEIEAELALTKLSWLDKWQMGRVLVSALCYAQIYKMDQEARGGERGWQRPLFLVKTAEGLELEKKTIDRTRHEPFPKWTRPTDNRGNRLVRPCRPCPTNLEFEPTISDKPWLEAVHRLESIPFRINKALLRWAKETDANPDTRVIPHLPPNFERNITALENDKKKLGIDEIEKLWVKDEKLRKKDRKANDNRYEKISSLSEEMRDLKGDKFKQERARLREEIKALKDLPPIKSKGYHTTEKQDGVWNKYWEKAYALEDKRQRYEATRLQFESELVTAETLLKDGRPFYQRVSVDYRGRLYLPDFSYQGSDFCRAVIEFDGAQAVDKDGWKHLLRHTANAFGKANTFEEKIKFRLPDSNTSRYINIGLDPLGQFKHWEKADKPFCFLRSCIEIMDVTTPWLKGILDGDDPEQLKRMSGEATLSKAKEWFRKVTSRYSVLDLHPMEWVDGDGDKYVSGDYHDAPDNLHYLSHLPCEIDQSNSAFQHIAQMMNRRDIYEKVLGIDVYSDVANKLPSDVFSGLKNEDEKRKIVKLVAVPWSYGARLKTIKKAVTKTRRLNPDKISYLEDLDDSEITDLCRSVIKQLNTEYPVFLEYQEKVKAAVQAVEHRQKDDFVEWDTPLGFIAHQKVHKTKPKEDLVYPGPEYKEQTGKDDREVRAKLPKDEIDWDEMRTKAPPNLVHSYDSALVHGTLWAGGRFYQVAEKSDQQSPITWGATGMQINEDIGADSKRIISGIPPYWDDPDLAHTSAKDSGPKDTNHWLFPVVTVHDAFSCLASHCDDVIDALQHNFQMMYAGFDPLQRFLESVTEGTYPLRHRDYRWVSHPDQFS